ncbi:MAG TPA: o-succinylbenzoate synthase [Flavobacteriaceae bacterium]|jgi:o-succinylbenzoate synthase|nr:o-succinylbenzoate synthase [Flavobacteriaceae bacterium]MAY53399.1 o-succinylbenzoate synthase [Flavobacteriaceae bacterium]HBR52711.1 o-succinylbenzoate synthase [Flavobacteriaceae bacterium]|tara:strand:+ start:70812 stop:71861 length:1050 start_codon:yes stop_codon:yes gene_type:complete
MKATFQKYTLQFKKPAGTSRGTLQTKETWFLTIVDGNRWGIGECGMFRGLSADDVPDFEQKLQWTCEHISKGEQALYDALSAYPAIQIGVETAFKSLAALNPFQIFSSEFSLGNQSIPINGLVWMGDRDFMKQQISEKLKAGFKCIKMKIGAIDFDKELALLKMIRELYSPSEIELRVDANGAFSPSEALEKLKILSDLQIHSIEQPIQQGQWQEMARLCEESPLPIALDEELIGVTLSEEKEELLQTIQPQYIILKPTLVGGFRSCDEWIRLSESQGAGWWITSALESNIGLNAIAQYTAKQKNKLPQGLGTGSLYTNNIPAPLQVIDGTLHYNKKRNWDVSVLNKVL